MIQFKKPIPNPVVQTKATLLIQKAANRAKHVRNTISNKTSEGISPRILKKESAQNLDKRANTMMLGRLNDEAQKTPLPITPLSGNSKSRSGYGSGGFQDELNRPYSITASELNHGRRAPEDSIDSAHIDTERDRLHKLAQTKLRLV